MATATPSRPGPATPPARAPTERPRRGLRGWAAAIGTTVGVAVLLWLVYAPAYVNYDAQWALAWAHDAWHGFLPEYTADFAPTPHPLATAVSSLALPFGAHADTAMLWLTLLSFGALVYLTYRLGEVLFNRWVGLVAALVVVSRPVIMRDALIGYQDLPFAALVIGAVLLEAQRSRRGLPVLALLALAGLLRPEAWVLAGLYWLYLWPATTPRERVRSAALVAAAPLIWAGTDWIVTGDPLHSLHGTAALAEEVDRRRDPEDVPYWSVQYLGFVLRLPLLLGIPVGLVFAWFYTRRRALLLLAVIAAMLAVFAVGPVFGLPLIRRYVETPAVLLTLFYGLAVCGFTLLPAGRARTRWMVIGGLAAALSVAYLPSHVVTARPARQPAPARRGDLPPARARGPLEARERRVRALRAPGDRRSPPDPVHPLLARRRARLGPHGRGRHRPDGPHVAAAAPHQDDQAHVQQPAVPERAGAGGLPPDLPQPGLARLRRARLLSRMTISRCLGRSPTAGRDVPG